ESHGRRIAREQNRSALLPGQAVEAPAAEMSALALVVDVALEAFEDVVRLATEFRGPYGGGGRAHAAATQQNQPLAGRYGLNGVIEVRIRAHVGPVFPGQTQRARYVTHPLQFGLGAHVDQQSLATLHPGPGRPRGDVPGVAP